MARDALSASKLSLLRECPRAYHERYVVGRKARATVGKRRGSLVHLCLERAGKARIGSSDPFLSGLSGDAPLEELLGYLEEYTARAGYPAEVVREAREVLELCAPLDLSHVRHVEDEWKLTARDGRTCTTRIDRADYHDTYEDRGGKGLLGPTVLIHDYKTHGDVRPRAEHRDVPQTLFYLAAVKERYPDEHVGIVFDYVRSGISHAPIWWDADLDRQARGTIEETLEEIDRRTAGLDRFGEASADPWPASPAPGACRDCAYQAGCSGFAALLETQTTAVPDPTFMTVDDLLREYVTRRDAKEANEDRKKALGAELRQRIGAGNEVVGAKLKAKLVSPRELYLDPNGAAQAIDAAVQANGGFLALSLEEIVQEIAPRELSTRRLGELLAKQPAAVRAACKKALEEIKIPIDCGSHVRVEDYLTPFEVGEEQP